MKEDQKREIEKDLKSLFKSMDFINHNFLSKNFGEKKLQMYFNIYQQLGLAWEFLGLQCEHGKGHKKIRDKKKACRICGKIKGAPEFCYLLPKSGNKKLGVKLKPNSKKTFENKAEAKIISDSINFHGALVSVDVHNGYKSKFGKSEDEINIAADRTVKLKERDIECHVDQHLIDIDVSTTVKKIGKKRYGGFPWEIKNKNLRKFPVIFDFDENHQFLGLTILR